MLRDSFNVVPRAVGGLLVGLAYVWSALAGLWVLVTQIIVLLSGDVMGALFGGFVAGVIVSLVAAVIHVSGALLLAFADREPKDVVGAGR